MIIVNRLLMCILKVIILGRGVYMHLNLSALLFYEREITTKLNKIILRQN